MIWYLPAVKVEYRAFKAANFKKAADGCFDSLAIFGQADDQDNRIQLNQLAKCVHDAYLEALSNKMPLRGVAAIVSYHADAGSPQHLIDNYGLSAPEGFLVAEQDTLLLKKVRLMGTDIPVHVSLHVMSVLVHLK